MNATEAAAEIRAEFKKRGWTPRQIGVRSDYYSLGSSVTITIKDGSIPVHVAREIGEQRERIHRCEATGEILGGGNRYIDVRLTPEAQKAKEAPYIEAVTAAWAELAAREARGTAGQHHVNIGDTAFSLALGIQGWGFHLWGPSAHIQQVQTPADAAYCMAVRIEKARDEAAA